MEHRTHPYTIVVNLWRVFYLFIFPVIRGFFAALQSGIVQWARGAWVDILFFLFMVTLATLQWRAQKYVCDNRGIRVMSGLFFRRDTFIRWDCMSTLSIKSPFFLHPIHVSVLRADTIGGSNKNTDVALYLSTSRAREILSFCRESSLSVPAQRRYRPRATSIMALGLLDSNSLTGILFIATFISQAGRLLGNEFSDLIVDTFETLIRSLSAGIPPAATAVAYISVAGWLIAFARTILRYMNFLITRGEGGLSIKSGRFTKRDHLVNYDKINFIDIRQTLGLKMLKLYSLYIYAVGYGKRKDDIACVLPAERESVFKEYRSVFFPNFVPCEREIAPKRGGFMRFISKSLYLLIIIPIAIMSLSYSIPPWKDVVVFIGIMSMLPSLLFLMVRLYDFLTCGVGRNGNFYTIRYSKGFQLHTIIVSADKIVKVEIRQGLLQRLFHNCDLYFHTMAEGRSRHRCRNLRLYEVEDFLKV